MFLAGKNLLSDSTGGGAVTSVPEVSRNADSSYRRLWYK